VALASPALHVYRVAQRVIKGGHDIPPDTAIRRYWQSLENLPAAAKLANRVAILDNSDVEKRTVFRSQGGLILELDPHPPAWFQTLLPAVKAALGA